MKQIIFLIFIFFFVSFHLTGATPPTTMPEIPEVNVDIWEILDRALNWFFGIALVVAAIMLVYAGFNYVTAGGNDEKIKTATKTLIFALIGVVIALLAKGLPLLIQEFLQGNGSSSLNTNYSSDTISNSDLLANSDFSSIQGGNIPNPNCPPTDLSCDPCQYSSTADGDVYPCGSSTGGGGSTYDVLL